MWVIIAGSEEEGNVCPFSPLSVVLSVVLDSVFAKLPFLFKGPVCQRLSEMEMLKVNLFLIHATADDFFFVAEW